VAVNKAVCFRICVFHLSIMFNCSHVAIATTTVSCSVVHMLLLLLQHFTKVNNKSVDIVEILVVL
jgi:hypothetical protein